MRLLMRTEQKEHQENTTTLSKEKRTAWSKKASATMVALLAICAVFATIAPNTASAQDDSWFIYKNKTFDDCLFWVQAGTYSGRSATGSTYVNNNGASACQVTVKTKLGYRRDGRNYYTAYRYGRESSTIHRSNAFPRYTTGCLHGRSAHRWSCQTVWT